MILINGTEKHGKSVRERDSEVFGVLQVEIVKATFSLDKNNFVLLKKMFLKKNS